MTVYQGVMEMPSLLVVDYRYWRVVRSVLVAIVAVVIATASRLALDPWLGDRQAFLTYLAAVIAVLYFGDVLASLIVAVAGIPFAAWFFLDPRRTFIIVDMSEKVAFAAYLGLALPIVALGALYWRSRTRIRESEDQSELLCNALMSERERLEREHESLRTELRSLDQRRGDFLSLLATELRRPLAPLASATALHSTAATPSEMETAMAIVRREVTQLGRLIEDLLDAFQRNGERSPLERERIDLTAVVSSVIDSIRSVAAQTGRSLSVSMLKAPVWVDGDVQQLERLTHNLLMSSIRGTSVGEEIGITVHNREGEALLKVRDTGIGLAPGDIKRIFQVDKFLSSDRRWMSLSLSAAKPIVEMHGGTITVTSDGEGQGCEFVVRLPLRSAPLKSPSTTAEIPGSEKT